MVKYRIAKGRNCAHVYPFLFSHMSKADVSLNQAMLQGGPKTRLALLLYVCFSEHSQSRSWCQTCDQKVGSNPCESEVGANTHSD